MRSSTPLLALAALLIAFVMFVVPTAAATPGAGWSIHSVAEPTNFSAADARDNIVELAVIATKGTYRLSLHGGEAAAELTEPIQWNESAEGLQRTLETVTEVGAGNVSVTGGPGGSKPYTITWIGALSSSSLSPVLRENELKNGPSEGTVVRETIQEPAARDRFALTVVNVGSRASEGEVTIEDTIPGGLVPVEMRIKEPVSHVNNECSLTELKCTYSEPVAAGRQLVVEIRVAVTSPSLVGPLINKASVSGGGGGEASTSASNEVNVGPAPFGIDGLAFEADGVDGVADPQAGEHPYGVTTTIDLNTLLVGNETHPVQNVKAVSVELSLGFAGDPLAAERCPEIDLTDSEGSLGTPQFRTKCPPGSMVGRVSLKVGGSHLTPYPVYNVTPDHGYPAELGFNAGLGQPVFVYASVVRSASGDRLRIAAPGAIHVTGLEVEGLWMTVYGDPGEVNGMGGRAAFVTNPTRCSTEPVEVNTEVTAWEGGSAHAEATAYPDLTGCNLLQGAAAFDPGITVEPETTQADTPSGYEVDLKLPQAANVFGALATPELKNATVTLPAGVSISPSAASGPDALGGCPATGEDGINVGSGEVAPDGQDLGDPEATELGEGHPGGGKYEHSPYDDGMWHTAPGHCPENSRLGEVEVTTPDLAEPLRGHVYLAEPNCGQAGQAPCTEAEAEAGRVFGLYLEVAGSGVIVKLAGTVEAGGYGAHSRETGLAPGQLRAHFNENPQFPFEELKLTFPGGQRAALANPQTCGHATTTSELEPWSHSPPRAKRRARRTPRPRRRSRSAAARDRCRSNPASRPARSHQSPAATARSCCSSRARTANRTSRASKRRSPRACSRSSRASRSAVKRRRTRGRARVHRRSGQ